MVGQDISISDSRIWFAEGIVKTGVQIQDVVHEVNGTLIGIEFDFQIKEILHECFNRSH